MATTLQIEDAVLDTEKPAAQALEEIPQRPTEEKTTLYPKIHKLSDLLARRTMQPLETVHLTGSTKLHGTHADIVFVNGSDEIRLQSRNQPNLTLDKDNCGFAAFIAGTEKALLFDLRNRILDRYRSLNPGEGVTGNIVIAGEWCGNGIQKKVAIVKIPKFFAIVSISINDLWVPDWDYRDISNEGARIFHIGKAGIFTHRLRRDDIPASEARIKEMTDAVEKECPFAMTFGISGLGEGIVWKATDYCGDPKYWFKSKGDQMAVSNSDKLPASAVDKENLQRIQNFAKAIVTENRLEQGWEYLDQQDAAGLGAFLKWLTNDCLVEEKREMEALGIAKGRLSSAIVAIAKPWFWARIARESRGQ